MLKEEENVTYYSKKKTIHTHLHRNTHTSTQTKNTHTFSRRILSFLRKTKQKMRTLIELSFSHIAAEREEEAEESNPRLNLLKL